MSHPKVCFAFVLAHLSSAAFAQTELATFMGSSAGISRGYSVAGGPDFDSDGWSDLVVGTPYASSGSFTENGAVHVISGRTGAVIHVKTGDESDDHFGFSVAVCGDVDADGVSDVIVGAPNGSVSGVRRGRARVFSGATGANLHNWVGALAGSGFGFSVGGGFDTNQDGHADLIVGSPYFGIPPAVNQGMVTTYSGSNGAQMFSVQSPQTDNFTGWSVASLGDVDNDGQRDFGYGAPGFSGAAGSVVVFSGDSTSVSSSVLHVFVGANPGDQLGSSLDGALDVNGDGFSDIVAGAVGEDRPGELDVGAVRVFGGQAGGLLKIWWGNHAGGRLGYSVAVIGDINQNGVRDIIAGAPWANYARVFDPIENSLITVIGTIGDFFGTSVADAGDFNNDGVRDFVVGAPFANSPVGFDVGFARVYSSCPWFASYCTAGTTTNGCTARMNASGAPSASATSGFLLTATHVEGAKSGIVFYGLSGRNAAPWGSSSSFLCVKAPTQRTTAQLSGGTAGQCDGTISVDWLDYLATHPGALGSALIAGQVVNAQCWFRDPPSPKTTSMSDALEFVVCP